MYKQRFSTSYCTLITGLLASSLKCFLTQVVGSELTVVSYDWLACGSTSQHMLTDLDVSDGQCSQCWQHGAAVRFRPVQHVRR